MMMSAFAVIWASSLFAAIPQSINYQGRLTDAVGVPVNGKVDLVFAICRDSLCAGQIWSESQTGVIVKDGLFNVVLGSINPIQGVVFDGSVRFLSISMNGSPVSKRMPMVSVAHAFRSINADTANFAKSSGGATDCADCNTVFVNVVGPDSVYATSGTAFLGKTVGNSSANIIGINGYGSNGSNGYAYGGYFGTSDDGTATHIGVKGDGQGASDGEVYGVQGTANNTSTGDTYGGRFTTTTNGTGVHIALSSKGWGNSSSSAYGIDASAVNASSGSVFGGVFTALTGGTGLHFGVYTTSYSTFASNYGVWSVADNTSSSPTHGGFFRATSSGTGNHYAVTGNALSAAAGDAYGYYGWAQNTSTGDAYGGFFESNASGTGVHYGIRAESYGASSSPVDGVNSYARNTSTGAVYAGLFTANSAGTGPHYGIYSQSAGSSSSNAYGAVGTASNNSSGTVYGISGTATNSSSGNTMGGVFYTSSSGTGNHTGVAAWGYNDDATPCTGVYGVGQNTVGPAYGGYFAAPAAGTQSGYGVYAEGTTLAGYFRGTVWVQGTLDVTGDKNAAVKIDNGDYRLLSCQESPEVWFEDFGEGQLVKGRTHIDLDPVFLQTVTIDDRHPMKVFIQLNDEKCNGTAVKRGSTGFDVIELQNGTSNASLSYRVVAKRRGYEDVRLTVAKAPNPEAMSARSKQMQDAMEKDRAKIVEDDQRVNQESQPPKKRSEPVEEK